MCREHHINYLKSVTDPVFSPGGGPTPRIAIIFQSFAKKWIKMKEFGHIGRGRESLAPAPLDSPIEITLFSGNEIKFPK